jgi:hypothetical protein
VTRGHRAVFRPAACSVGDGFPSDPANPRAGGARQKYDFFEAIQGGGMKHRNIGRRFDEPVEVMQDGITVEERSWGPADGAAPDENLCDRASSGNPDGDTYYTEDKSRSPTLAKRQF